MSSEAVKAGYKKTEVGVIPEDWEVKRFEEVMTGFFSGQTPSRFKPEFYKGEIPWITSSELNYNIICDTVEKITEEAVKNKNLKILPKGTFLFAITGLEAEGTRGKCAITGIEATTNQSCMALFPKTELKTKYLFYYYVKFGDWLAYNYCQGTKQQSYTGKTARKLPIVYPKSIKKQIAIAAALSDTDALIASLEKLIAKKKEIKQAAMQELLTGKRRLPGFGDGKGYKQTEVGMIPEDWGVKNLKECIKGNPRYGINSAAVPYSDKLPQYLRITDISEEGTLFKNRIVSVNHPNVDNYYLKDGDLVFARTGASVGKSYLHKKENGNFVFAGFLIQIQPDQKKLKPEFLSNYVKTKKYWGWVKLMSTRSGQPGINGNEYGQLPIPLPSLPEQTAIAEILSDMDDDIAGLEQKRDKVLRIKEGMMQELLTGRIRLV